mmetsp:Transcript_11689/g.21078  ORF Transcript_11689/g.21078 Transcript_11689/m.21078 type:complete len:365 (-) Transcript_11689:61-1155(-)
MLSQKQKSIPAYKGARFNANGFCLTHNDVRLSRLATNGNHYAIVRKTCYKCGSAALISNPHIRKKTGMHGYKKESATSRDVVPSEFRRSGGSGDYRHLNNCKMQDERGSARRRSRTLSPQNRRDRAHDKSSKKTLSAPYVLQIQRKLSNETIKGLMDIKPPFSNNSAMISRSSNRDKRQERSTSEVFARCCVHPQVKLSIRRTTSVDGKWQISKDVCPLCFPSSSTTHNTNNGLPPLVGILKNGLANNSIHPRSTTPPPMPSMYQSPPKSTSRAAITTCADDYFATEMVVYEEASRHRQQRQHSPTSVLMKTTNTKRSNWRVLPNSTARIARALDRQKKEKRDEHPKQSQEVYEAWEALPVHFR